MRFLYFLPGGLGRFVPCSVGADHCRLRHVGWEKCGHGLTSRPRESASEGFLDQLLLLFQYPPRSSRTLLDGTLPLRYCSTRFARRVLTWSLPMPGHAAALVFAGVGSVGDGEAQVGDEGVQHTSLVISCYFGHVFGRGCIILGIQMFQVLIVQGGVAISMLMGSVLFIPGLG